MKNFLTFTLAAGVAITSTTIVHAAGVAKTGSAAKTSSSASRQAPAGTANAGAVYLDRNSFNRELTRLSDLLTGPNSDDLMSEEGVVGRKSTGAYTF